ncbi:MAG TPA: hypothetical protein PLJ27_02620 [Polyangiaceae bacterium]|nr:MAG: hypothetical protein BWY17_05181 [Deltaproteobacteria bacterium ADurb.Bin207]HNS96414.1 hypothetical protein [Polyangiaceae bacterium]HNZ22883.1 hypothetical protein [Polyangiaceae bacterium]HOD21286.1 hypothetical protein [Polyangiaceae bacterium]HOE48445.1 hypothetical protein [Polyangiaceae bacterium]
MTSDSQKQPPSCTVCGASIDPQEEQCPSCGATRDKRHTCPFCGVVAVPTAHPEFRLACPSCGGPRIPMPSGTKLNKASLAALQASRRAYSSRAAWRVASGLTAAFGLLAVMLLIGVFFIAKLSFFPLLMASIIAAAPLVFAALAFRKSKQTQSLIQSSLDRAWLESTKQLAAHQGPIQAETLMQAYGIDADQASSLLVRLGANEEVVTQITDDGQLALSVHPPFRVAVPDVQKEPEQVEVLADSQQESANKASW